MAGLSDEDIWGKPDTGLSDADIWGKSDDDIWGDIDNLGGEAEKGLLSGTGTILKSGAEAYHKAVGDLPDIAENSTAYNVGNILQEGADKKYGNPVFEKAHPILSETAAGIGGIAPVIAGSMIDPALAPALAIGYGAAASKDPAFQAAIQKGATPDKADVESNKEALIGGGTMMLPMEAAAAPFAKIMGGPWVAQKLAQLAATSATGVTAMEAQEYLNSQLRKDYDPNSQYTPDTNRMASNALMFGTMGLMHPSDAVQATDSTQPAAENDNNIPPPPSPTVEESPVGPSIQPDDADDADIAPQESPAEAINTSSPNHPTSDLRAVPSDASDSFNVVDRDGDFVQGGFDSQDAAQSHIDDLQNPLPPEPQFIGHNAPSADMTPEVATARMAKLEKIHDAPETSEPARAVIKEQMSQLADIATAEPPPENNYAPIQAKVDAMRPEYAATRLDSLNKKAASNAGLSTMEMAEKEALSAKKPTQTVIPGAEAISDKALAERTMQNPLQEKVAQKPANEGLFDTTSIKQRDLPLQQPKASSRPPQLPPHLDGSKPRYGSFIPEFESGIDKAAYIIQNAKNSKANQKFKDFLSRHGFSDAAMQAHGEAVKAAIKPIAKDTAAGDKLTVPEQSRTTTVEVAPKKKITNGTILPAESGKPTNLNRFIKNNGGIKDIGGDLEAMGHDDLANKKGMDWDKATQIAHGQGYFPERPSIPELQDALSDNGGKNIHRMKDQAKIDELAAAKESEKQNDPAYVEHYANKIGIKTEGKTKNQLIDLIKQFHENEAGSFGRRMAGLKDDKKPVAWALRGPIEKIEKITGKLTGGTFDKIGDAYVRIMAPELANEKSLRADAYLAKNKAEITNARNALHKMSATAERAWDKAKDADREKFLEEQDTGNYNKNDPAHARYKALTDATFKAEKAATGGDPTKGYRSNYFPRLYEKADAVKAYFSSPAMVKKFGRDWFNKARPFDLYQEAKKAGFKLITNNPETLLQMRLMAGQDMIAKMNLLKDFQRDGLATRASAFSVDKRITKTSADLKNVAEKYKEAMKKINDPRQSRWNFAEPAVRKYTEAMKERGIKLKQQLADLNEEKKGYTHPKATYDDLKDNSFKIIGPDDHVWNLHSDMAPLWKNAVDSQGLWENKGLAGDAYRGWQTLRSTWVPIKLGLSLFHPLHVATIHVATGLAAAAEHVLGGGSRLEAAKNIGQSLKLGFGIAKGLKNVPGSIKSRGVTGAFKDVQDHPLIEALATPVDKRTPEQHQLANLANEGGFVPSQSERDTIHFHKGFNDALDKVTAGQFSAVPALALKGTQGLVRGISKPIFEHWIPWMKSEAYLMRAKNALARDPSLLDDAGRRGEVLRKIAKDTDRTYGEMNYDTLFWNKTVRDAFTASFLSGGWKLAQLYYARGLAESAKVAYKALKTGEINPKDVSYNMLFSYIYGGMGLALGAAMTKMLGGAVKSLEDMVFPQTGEKDKDGKPIRVSLPFFNKEFFSLGKDINEKGLIGGSGSFVYNQSLYKGIYDTLNNQDWVGRKELDPSDINQWAHAAWETVEPMTVASRNQAQAKGSTFGAKSALLGIGLAPAYANQTPFEQKVLYLYNQTHPPKDDAYTASLKQDLRLADKQGDTKAVSDISDKLSKQGLTDKQITGVTKQYNEPFVNHAWKGLTAQQQVKLWPYASKAEKDNFTLKGQ